MNDPVGDTAACALDRFRRVLRHVVRRAARHAKKIRLDARRLTTLLAKDLVRTFGSKERRLARFTFDGRAGRPFDLFELVRKT